MSRNRKTWTVNAPVVRAVIAAADQLIAGGEYPSPREVVERCPWWKPSTIRTALSDLKAMGLIVVPESLDRHRGGKDAIVTDAELAARIAAVHEVKVRLRRNLSWTELEEVLP